MIEPQDLLDAANGHLDYQGSVLLTDYLRDILGAELETVGAMKEQLTSVNGHLDGARKQIVEGLTKLIRVCDLFEDLLADYKIKILSHERQSRDLVREIESTKKQLRKTLDLIKSGQSIDPRN